MSINPLNDISRVYLEQVVFSEEFVDPEHGEAPSGRSPLQNVSDHPKASVRKKAVKGFRKQMEKEYGGKWKSRSNDPVKEALDPVGKEDADIDNDGDTDKSDKYLHKRRKVIGKAIAVRKEALDPVGQEDDDIDNDGDSDESDSYLKNRRKVRGSAISKKKIKEGFSNWRQDLAEVIDDTEANTKIKEKKVNNKIKINPTLGEAVENLGGQLIEMIQIDGILDEFTDSEINLLSDSLIEKVVEEVFYTYIEEGYEIDEIEDYICESVDTSLTILTEAPGAQIREGVLQKIKGAVKKVAKGIARGAGYVAGAAVRGAKALGREAKAGYERGRSGSSGTTTSSTSSSSGESEKESGEKKPGILSRVASKLKRGLKKAVASGARAVSRGARNVARKVEGGETKKAETPKAAPKKAEPVSDPWEGSYKKSSEVKAKTKKAAAPKAKAPAKKKKTGKLDSLLSSIRNEELEIEEGMTMKDFKANRRKLKRREASADAKKRGHVGKEWYNSGRTYSPDEAKSGRAKLDDAERSTRHRSSMDPEGDDNLYSADKTKNPKKLRKQKAMGELGEGYLDEKTLTKTEMSKREEIVKSMKSKASDFEKRYPGRGKEVMYATATKMAKKMAEQNLDEIAPLIAGGLALGGAALAGATIKRAQDAAKSGVDAAKSGAKVKPSTGIAGAAYGMQKRNQALQQAMDKLK